MFAHIPKVFLSNIFYASEGYEQVRLFGVTHEYARMMGSCLGWGCVDRIACVTYPGPLPSSSFPAALLLLPAWCGSRNNLKHRVYALDHTYTVPLHATRENQLVASLFDLVRVTFVPYDITQPSTRR